MSDTNPELAKALKEIDSLKKEMVVNDGVTKGLQSTITELETDVKASSGPDLEMQSENMNLKAQIQQMELEKTSKTTSGYVPGTVTYKRQKRVKDAPVETEDTQDTPRKV